MKTLRKLVAGIDAVAADVVEPWVLRNLWWILLLSLWVLLLPSANAEEALPVEPTGSPEWFRWDHFVAGWGGAWTIIGPMWLYRLAKKSADDALD